MAFEKRKRKKKVEKERAVRGGGWKYDARGFSKGKGRQSVSGKYVGTAYVKSIYRFVEV